MSDSDTKHLFFARASGPRAAFRERVFEALVPRLRDVAPSRLKLSLTERENPSAPYLPLRKDNLVMVSAWGEVDVAAFHRALAEFTESRTEVFGYRVRESYPLHYEKTWKDGERSPGTVLLTLLAKRRSLSYEAFMYEWHGRHTPKAMRIHPMWSYARNVVEANTDANAPDIEGVVEEHYRDLRDVTNPMRMFGGPWRFLPQMVEVALHANHFLDLSRTQNYLLSEYHLVSA